VNPRRTRLAVTSLFVALLVVVVVAAVLKLLR